MPEWFSYIGAQLNKLNAAAPTFALKIESRDYSDGKCSGETHWISFTPEDMHRIANLMLEIESEQRG